MVIDYRTGRSQKVIVCSIPCEFSDMRIDRSTMPEGRYWYEVAIWDCFQSPKIQCRRYRRASWMLFPNQSVGISVRSGQQGDRT